MRKFCYSIILILTIVLTACVAFRLARYDADHLLPPLTVTDTVRYVDTIRYYNPVPVAVKPHGTAKVAVSKAYLMAVADSLPHIRADTAMRDSIDLDIPLRQMTYKGEGYTAYLTAAAGGLDSIVIQQRHDVVTIRNPPDRWHVGITAGYGTDGKGFSPFIGVGITYSLISF